MAIIDVVKMDFESDEFVKKFGVTDKTPEGSTELSTWTQLIVSESQEAVLLRQGALDGPFGPGRHVLKTENIPGTLKSFNKEDIRNYFKGMVLTVSKTVLAKQIIERQISVLEIATDLLYLSEKIEEELQGRLSEFGLKLVNFFIDTIDVVDDQDESIKTLRTALAKRAEMKIVGYNYQQARHPV
jgi:membrane protease subunit (stomatin/prohibitin family)